MIQQNYPGNEISFFSTFFGKLIINFAEKMLSIYHRLLLTCLTLSIALSASPAIGQTNQTINNSDWIGSYYFSEIASTAKRRRSQDVVPSASYEITIKERSNNLAASFAANGVQLFEAYECSVVVKNNILEFYFQDLGSSEIQNFRRFKKGDLLFRLSKADGGKSSKYLFQPVTYKIVRINPGKQKIPVYFEKPPV